jgi:predicted dehydrogenase
LTAKEAKQVLAAAKERGVFVMEAMWTRFIPLVAELRRKLFEEKIIGEVKRTFCDFGLDMNIKSLGPESRLKNPDLGAGSLLDIGIYSLTWGLLTLEEPGKGGRPQIVAAQTLSDGVDVATSMILQYPGTGRQGILTSTTDFKTDPAFCRIEGTAGHITISGQAASVPSSFTVHHRVSSSPKGDVVAEDTSVVSKSKTYSFDHVGKGFYYEADAVALDIAAGRRENALMPHSETIRVMEIMDQVRRLGGAKFKQDDQ